MGFQSFLDWRRERRKLLNAVVAEIHHENPALRVNGHIGGPFKFSGGTPLSAKLDEEIPIVGVSSPHFLVQSVS